LEILGLDWTYGRNRSGETDTGACCPRASHGVSFFLLSKEVRACLDSGLDSLLYLDAYAHTALVFYSQLLFYRSICDFNLSSPPPDGAYFIVTYTIICNEIAAYLLRVMDASSLLALPTSPAPTGLQIFAIFVNFFFPALALLVVSVRVAGRAAVNKLALDDSLVCIAMLMSIAETVISFFCSSNIPGTLFFGRY
jgi:hypothetical protein